MAKGASSWAFSFKYDPFGRRIYKSSSAGTLVDAHDGDNLKPGNCLLYICLREIIPP